MSQMYDECAIESQARELGFYLKKDLSLLKLSLILVMFKKGSFVVKSNFFLVNVHL